jgi:hypothetical protein
MTTEYKQLCAELISIEDALSSGNVQFSNQGQALDGYSALAAFRDVAARARDALAEPEPEGPTDEELLELMPEDLHKEFANWSRIYAEHADIKPGLFRVVLNTHAVDFARAVFARWGRPTPRPIPVSERLPGPEDCDAEGEVWAWRRFDPEGDMDNGDHWMLAFHEWLEDEDCGFTHWLPAHALPQPS